VAQKKLQEDSSFSKYDKNGDDLLCDAELATALDLEFRRRELEDADRRDHAIHDMVCPVWNPELSSRNFDNRNARL